MCKKVQKSVQNPNLKRKYSFLKEMSFKSLPKDLQNVIVGFSWGITAKQLYNNLSTCAKIVNWDLHPVFIRNRVWCSHTHDYVENPLSVFRPIAWFGNNWKAVFDWCIVSEILHRLDFRKRMVRRVGTRDRWLARLKNWRTIRVLNSFFAMMMHLNRSPFKPTYQSQRFNHMKPFWR